MFSWSLLTVTTSSDYFDHYQAYWAGYLEANLTYNFINAHWINTVRGNIIMLDNLDLCPEPLSKDCRKLKTYLSDNMKYMVQQANYLSKFDQFWNQVINSIFGFYWFINLIK